MSAAFVVVIMIYEIVSEKGTINAMVLAFHRGVVFFAQMELSELSSFIFRSIKSYGRK